jgi:hypothetical protein
MRETVTGRNMLLGDCIFERLSRRWMWVVSYEYEMDGEVRLMKSIIERVIYLRSTAFRTYDNGE